MDSATTIPVTVTPEMPFTARLRLRMQSQNLNQKKMALSLGVGLTELNAWARGKKYPARRYWPLLSEKGLATQDELKQWKPGNRLPRRDSRGGRIFRIRTARGRETAVVYSLKQMAALATD